MMSILFLGCVNNVDNGKIAPDFSLENLSPNNIILREYRGN
jgi:peroxiredoxin